MGIRNELALEKARTQGFLPQKQAVIEKAQLGALTDLQSQKEQKKFALTLALTTLDSFEEATLESQAKKGKSAHVESEKSLERARTKGFLPGKLDGAEEAKVEEKEKVNASKTQKKDPLDIDNIWDELFEVLMVALNTKQDSVESDTELLKADNQLQQNWNNYNNLITINVLPDNATPAQIAQYNTENEAATALKGNIQSELVTLRQGSQLDMTSTNADVDSMQQDVSMDSDWLQTISSISQVVNQMNQRTF